MAPPVDLRRHPKRWRYADARQAGLRARFARVSRRTLPRPTRLGRLRPYRVGLLVVLCLAAIAAYRVYASPWSVELTLRHLAAAPNCDAARAVGLAPAARGEPGYYPQHDRDQDGWACEPWPRRTPELPRVIRPGN